MPIYLTSSHNLMSDGFFILDNRLMFASLHGRDANIQSFSAALQSGYREKLGFSEEGSNTRLPVLSTATRFHDLVKNTTKYPTHNFGVLSHMFVYAEELAKPDFECKTGWVVLNDAAADLDKAAWQALQKLSDIPLLDHWQHRLVAELYAQGSIRKFQPGIAAEAAVVGISAVHVRIPDDFEEKLTRLLCQKELLP